MEAIERAIIHGARAGKLRRYVRENGEGLGGLQKLAARESAEAAALLSQIVSNQTPSPGEEW